METTTRNIDHYIVQSTLIDEHTVKLCVKTINGYESYERLFKEDGLSKALHHLFSQAKMTIKPEQSDIIVNITGSDSLLQYQLQNVDPPTVIENNGTQKWMKDGKLHRDGDLHAIIWADGSQEWYKEGKRHRDGDLPAIINADGTQEWYKEGKRHRDGDLPAIIGANGTQIWYRDGQRHRDGDQPAYIGADGTQIWYKEGKCPRDDDLPAYIGPDGTQQWYKNGIKTNQPEILVISKPLEVLYKEYINRMRSLRYLLKSIEFIPSLNPLIDLWKIFFKEHSLTFPSQLIAKDYGYEFRIQSIMDRIHYEINPFNKNQDMYLSFQICDIQATLKILKYKETIFYNNNLLFLPVSIQRCIDEYKAYKLYLTPENMVFCSEDGIRLIITLTRDEILNFLREALGVCIDFDLSDF